ncbi:MAG: hypothetical protein Q8Q28_03365 [Pseudomonadota bacterium]|nr:hypothetical protein [Pseudomonadota bacterium]
MKILNFDTYLRRFGDCPPYSIRAWAEAAGGSLRQGEDLARLSLIDVLDITRRAIRARAIEANVVALGGLALIAEVMLDTETDGRLFCNALGLIEGEIMYAEAARVLQPHKEVACSN